MFCVVVWENLSKDAVQRKKKTLIFGYNWVGIAYLAMYSTSRSSTYICVILYIENVRPSQLDNPVV